MKVSFFETGRYVPPAGLPREWPVPAGAYDPETGAEAYRGMIERARFVQQLGFDWISLSEHHYSPRILTPSPPLAAAYLASHVDTIKIALLGPIVPVSNPIRVAEELAMLDTMLPGRFVFGLLRGTTNEYLSYDLNPKEARERTDEGMELILQGVDRAAALRLAGPLFPVPHGIDLAAPARPAAPADLCARGQRRGRRFRRAPPARSRRFVRQCRADGEVDRLLPPALHRVRLGAGAGRHHLARQHDPRPKPTRRPTRRWRGAAPNRRRRSRSMPGCARR